MTPSLDPLGDIIFWSRQLSEHALFLAIGLESTLYRGRAIALHEAWEEARGDMNALSAQGALTLDKAKSIVWRPTKNLADLKSEVLKAQEGGTWVGWLFPLFIEHTLRELSYFVERVWGHGLSPEQTYCQNVNFMQEHAEFAAHLLDPKAVALISQADSLSKEFSALREGCFSLTPTLIELGRRAGDKLDAYFKTQPISAKNSVIHPVLAEHVIREGQRFLETMNALSAP